LLEGLCPTPGVKQTTKKIEKQFNEEVMEPTSEVVEPPAHIPDPANQRNHVR